MRHALPKAEISRLSPNLSAVDLPSGKSLMDPGQEITHAYFLETGLASVVVAMADGSMVETGITGNDGLVGFPVLLGTKTIPTRTFMQIPGNGFRIKAQHLNGTGKMVLVPQPMRRSWRLRSNRSRNSGRSAAVQMTP